MNIAALLVAVVPVLASVTGEPKVAFEAPDYYVAGAPFRVRLLLEAPADGAKIAGELLTQAAFSVNGKALDQPGSFDPLNLKGDEKKTIEMDLASYLERNAAAKADFQLGWGTLAPRKVRVLAPAPKGVKFLDEAALPAADLTKYWVLLRTNRGDILLEFWPDVAPNHVRNFLELSAAGFYDDITFHRVMPGFMIQGGDPNGNGSGGGPRQLKAEFSDRPHVRGVLSAARRGTAGVPGPSDPLKDTASSQFFLMHADAPALDGSYSAFGKVITGMNVVDSIATTPTLGEKPRTPQVILRGLAVQAPADPAAWKAAQ